MGCWFAKTPPISDPNDIRLHIRDQSKDRPISPENRISTFRGNGLLPHICYILIHIH